MPTHVFHI